MPEYIRVKDSVTKHEYTTAAPAAEGLEVLKKDAVDPFGRPLPAKPYVDLAGKPAASKEK